MKSIQGRLGVWLVGSVILMFGLNWWVTSRAPRSITEDYILARLTHDGESLLVGLQFDPQGHPILKPGFSAPVYDRPYSGHYFLIESGDARLRSRSLWDEDLEIPTDDATGPTVRHLTGPQGQPLLARSTTYIKTGRPVRVTVAEDLTAIEAHIHRFRLRFGIVTLALLAILIVSQRAIVRMSLRPLDRVRKDCTRLEQGEICGIRDDVPMEVRPLVDEINHLVQVMQRRLERHRNAVGNLAHALKSPLTLLTQLVDRSFPDKTQRTAVELREAVRSIQAIADRELRRARLTGGAAAGQRFMVSTEVPELIEVMKKIHAGRNLHYEVRIPVNRFHFADREDMMELFGNLLDNASKWARSRVRLTVRDTPGLDFTIEDDGPGVAPEELEHLSRRGVRLDESTPGYGLGLSIVREIVAQYGGSLEFHTSETLSGLAVDVRLPPGA